MKRLLQGGKSRKTDIKRKTNRQSKVHSTETLRSQLKTQLCNSIQVANLLYADHHIFAFSFFQSSKICHPCDFNVTFVFEQKGSTGLFSSPRGGREVPGESTTGRCQVSGQGCVEAPPRWVAPTAGDRAWSQAPEETWKDTLRTSGQDRRSPS